MLLVGQLLSDEYQLAFTQVQASMDDIVALNREVVRQKHEITRYANDLAKSHQELEDSHSGVLALHRELDHEFRTPLHSILGLIQLLLEDSDGVFNGEQQKQVRFIRESTEELMALVNDRLDLSKIEAGKVSR